MLFEGEKMYVSSVHAPVLWEDDYWLNTTQIEIWISKNCKGGRQNITPYLWLHSSRHQKHQFVVEKKIGALDLGLEVSFFLNPLNRNLREDLLHAFLASNHKSWMQFWWKRSSSGRYCTVTGTAVSWRDIIIIWNYFLTALVRLPFLYSQR